MFKCVLLSCILCVLISRTSKYRQRSRQEKEPGGKVVYSFIVQAIALVYIGILGVILTIELDYVATMRSLDFMYQLQCFNFLMTMTYFFMLKNIQF